MRHGTTYHKSYAARPATPSRLSGRSPRSLRSLRLGREVHGGLPGPFGASGTDLRAALSTQTKLSAPMPASPYGFQMTTSFQPPLLAMVRAPLAGSLSTTSPGSTPL